MCVEIKPVTVSGQDGVLRSRYSGCALKGGEMVITIISQGALTVGHQIIAFEWWHDGKSKSGITDPYRKHKAFHLFPTELATDFWGFVHVAKDVVPGVIVRTRPVRAGADGPKSNLTGKAGSDHDAANRDLTWNATCRSWVVDWDHGWRAFMKAKADWKNPPLFNIANMGGKSCAGWVLEIAAVAGIDPGSQSYFCGFPVPAKVVSGGFAVPPQDPMK